MQIRTFDAKTLDAAQAAVRRTLGDDALILATESTPGGIRITAAVESETRIGDLLAIDDDGEIDPHVERVLAFHGVPVALAKRLAAAAAGTPTIESGLALALRPRLKTVTPAARQVVVGPPGHGKTLAVARLARAALAGHAPPRVLLFARRGEADAAVDALRRHLADTPLEVQSVDGMAALTALLDDGSPCLVDTPALLPHRAEDAARLRALMQRPDLRGTVVVSVEGQASGVLETVVDFLGLGCRSVLFTKLDVTRRYGALVAVAAAGVQLEAASISGRLDDGLARLSAAGLARLLARRSDQPLAAGT